MAVQILVIEDDNYLRENILMILRFEDYEALGASDGVQGLALARSHLPDLIICDIQMPHLDGYGVLKELRNTPATQMIPFIFLTARTDREALRHGMALGANDFIVKPFDFEDFLNAVKARLDRQNTIQERFAQEIDTLRQSLVFALPVELRDPLADILTRAAQLHQSAHTLTPMSIHDTAHQMSESAEILERHIENYLLFTQIDVFGYTPEHVFVRHGSSWADPSVIVRAVAGRVAAEQHREDDVTFTLPSALVHMPENHLFKISEELSYHILSVTPVGTPIRITANFAPDMYAMHIAAQGARLAAEIAAVLESPSLRRQWQFLRAPALGLIVIQHLLNAYDGELIWRDGPGSVGEWIVRFVRPQAGSSKD